ncbi:hypothetical protein BYT27DRAFT_7256501 [Phlegmacium glaucopus]|nr:hypothetical protein BYT27DRAFT_7256501 [Phlegmacium glaucopus]
MAKPIESIPWMIWGYKKVQWALKSLPSLFPLTTMSNNVTSLHNYLQEKQESHSLTWVESSTGHSSNIVWTVQCKVKGVVKGTGEGATKQAAKQAAAGQALSVS